MSTTSFSADFQAAASRNGLSTSKATAVADAIAPGADEVLINVFGSAPYKDRELLVVTSHGTYEIQRGTFSVKRKWAIPHADLVEVAPARGVGIRDYVIDGVVLQTASGTREFQTGFNEPSYATEVKREIAQANAQTAAQEIAAAAVAARGGGSAAAPQAAPEVGDGDIFHFDPEGPEKVAQQAQNAYRTQQWFESFGLYVKAVDKLHDFYVYEQFKNRQPSPGDAWIVEGVSASLGVTRELVPDAPIAEGVREVTHRLRTIVTAVGKAGGNPTLYQHTLDEVGRLTPDIDVSDIFWE
jgi:hypothetical protein